MQYRKFGKTDISLSSMGFGMTRFDPTLLQDSTGLEKCADLIIKAVDGGVNYIDNAHNYASGKSEIICGLALKQLDRKKVYIGAKTAYPEDKTAYDVLSRVGRSLSTLGTDYLDFLFIWSVMDEDHYKHFMSDNGPYMGALLAKEQGLVRHILFSNHADTSTAKKIIQSGNFDGVTLSYNLLNYRNMDTLLHCADVAKMGVIVMNPLAGGVIPQNDDFFKNIKYSNHETLAQSALRFVYSHKEVTCVLSGVGSESELNENISSFTDKSQFSIKRIEFVSNKMEQISGLCTGCGYCRKSCKKNIPIPELMQSYNMRMLANSDMLYRRTDSMLIQRILILKKLILDFKIFPDNSQNPCVNCGSCEKACTQHLPIAKYVKNMYDIIQLSAANKYDYKKRLDLLLNVPKYKKVGLYTAGGYTSFVISKYHDFFGSPDFEMVLFDGSPQKEGSTLLGYPIYNPDTIKSHNLDCIIISNYVASKDIYNAIKHYRHDGINVAELHTDEDVPWVF